MATKKKSSELTMEDLLAEVPPQTLASGDIVEAKVLSAGKNEVWLDLGLQGTGMVPRKEINQSVKLTPGEVISASVIEAESDLGFTILSLKKVAKEKGWDLLQQLQDKAETIEIRAYDANRGGLLVELEGIRGFLPVSQLTAQHYPRVSNADKDEILQKLNELVKQTLRVRILDVDRDQNKLILSEKEALREDTQARMANLKVGDEVDGVVTGTVDFGVFVTVDGIEGLIHISEISWDRVTNPADYVKVGDKVKAKIIAIDEDKLSLSMKQLKKDPWLDQIKEFNKDDMVEGTITRITPFGAFIQITPAIEALVHVSELADDQQKDPRAHFKVGEKRKFRVLEIDLDSRKISLSTKENTTSRKPAGKASVDKPKKSE